MLEWLFGKRKKKTVKESPPASAPKPADELPRLQKHETELQPPVVFPEQTPATQSSGKMTPEQARRFAEALSVYLHEEEDEEDSASDKSIP